MGGLGRVFRDHLGAVEGAVDIGRDRLRFAQRNIAVPHPRDAPEWMNRIDLRRVRPRRRELVRHALLLAHHANRPHESRLRHSDDLEFRHVFLRFD